jgi:hypothetical protein
MVVVFFPFGSHPPVPLPVEGDFDAQQPTVRRMLEA